MFRSAYDSSKKKKVGHKHTNYRPDSLFGNNANKHYFNNLKNLIEGRKAQAESFLLKKEPKKLKIEEIIKWS